MATWHTLESIRSEWIDADQIEDNLLEELLEVAQSAVISYAPQLTEVVFEPVTVSTSTAGVSITFSRVGDVATLTMTGETQTSDGIADFVVPADFVPLIQNSDNYYGIEIDLYDSYGSLYLDNPAEDQNFSGSYTYGANIAIGGKFAYISTAPSVGNGIPTNYRLAQMMHTRNLWNAARVGVDGSAGGDTFEITPRPLDWHVKQVLRPARAAYRVG